jgi:hypothetical protein
MPRRCFSAYLRLSAPGPPRRGPAAASAARSAPEFQALERIAALLSILGEILARICTKILREILADFLRGSPRLAAALRMTLGPSTPVALALSGRSSISLRTPICSAIPRRSAKSRV